MYDSTADGSHRPEIPYITFTPAQGTLAIRRTQWLSVDKLKLAEGQDLFPPVSRSGLVRYLARQGSNRLPEADKDSPIASKRFKDCIRVLIHVAIKCLPQMASQTARRCLSGAIDRAKRWAHLRIYADQVEMSGPSFLHLIEKALTDNPSQSTRHLMTKNEKSTGPRARDHECSVPHIERGPVKPRFPRTYGLMERLKGVAATLLRPHDLNRGVSCRRHANTTQGATGTIGRNARRITEPLDRRWSSSTRISLNDRSHDQKTRCVRLTTALTIRFTLTGKAP